MALESIPSSLKRSLFSYRPLVGPDAIRLVLRHPASDVSAELECSMEHVTLSQCNQDIINQYTALPYVWGDSTDRQHIVVDGCSFYITANLDSALRHIRDENGTMKVWADALCINQTDTAERNQQVQHMGSVYSIASHTIIYLGDSCRETDSVFAELSSLWNPYIRNTAMRQLRFCVTQYRDILSRILGSLESGSFKNSSSPMIPGFNAGASV